MAKSLITATNDPREALRKMESHALEMSIRHSIDREDIAEQWRKIERECQRLSAQWMQAAEDTRDYSYERIYGKA